MQDVVHATAVDFCQQAPVNTFSEFMSERSLNLAHHVNNRRSRLYSLFAALMPRSQAICVFFRR